jgi:hypothetical protein
VLTDTLSAPLHKTILASDTLRIPPPTVKGMLMALATPSTYLAHDVAFLMRSGNVKEDQFVGTFVAVTFSHLNWVACLL